MKENSIGHTYVACDIFLLSNELTRREWITETLLDSGVQSQLNYLRNLQIAIALYLYTQIDEWTSVINGIRCRCLSFLRRADNGWYVKSLIMILLTDYEHMLMDLKKALAQTKSLKTGRLSALSVESSQLQVRVVSKFHVISVKWSGNLCLNKNHLSSSLLITRILHLHNGRTSFQGSNFKKKKTTGSCN